MMKNNCKGYDQKSGLYTSRYYAKKDITGGEVVVKTETEKAAREWVDEHK